MSISRTSDRGQWGPENIYHTAREAFIEKQIDSCLYPTLVECINNLGINIQSLRIGDLASGHGGVAVAVCNKLSNVSEYLLIDVRTDNLEIAKNKLLLSNQFLNVNTFLCDGKSFDDFTGKAVDILFCWDAMVHFDILDVVGYLASLSKICNGYAVFHHSNLGVVTNDISQNLHYRNFMTAQTFAQLAISSGHTVVDQRLLACTVPSVDCVTVIKVGK
jgi:hypothetical protein